METVSFIKAAQQLGVSVEEIHQMIKGKKLKEVSKGKVSKDAVYALSGLNPSGHQTKSPVPKTVVPPKNMRSAQVKPVPGAKTITEKKGVNKKAEAKDTKKENDTNPSESDDQAFSLESAMKDLFPGIKLMSKEEREEFLKQRECDRPKYSKNDMKEVADVAYMKGKLAVYESMSEFKRKESV